MEQYINRIEEALFAYLPAGQRAETRLIESVSYSLKLPGKRVRPCLTLAFCELCRGDAEKALPYACAVEMIHTYSLIHDDLPCMDNDDYRRGQPSNHKVFGEDIALLAGDALQSMAYAAMLSDKAASAIGYPNAVKAAAILAEKSGLLGMVGGQTIDLVSEGKHADLDTLRLMDEKKTANLIEAACMIGCVAAGAPDTLVKAAERYAHAVGIAFQIVDDILDVTSTTDELGKPVGSDEENDKSTYVSLLGIEKCRETVDELTEEAIAALDAFKGDTEGLAAFARKLARRTK
jgi:geranylgeranyl diphosphate synthase type II